MKDRQEAGTRPEAELILCCARTRIGPEIAERIRALLREHLDWDSVLHWARSHGVLPLLYWSLDSTCPEGVPGQTLDRLRDEFLRNATRLLFHTAELVRLLNVFQEHGIVAVPYKGAVLAASLYDNLSLRPAGDLDILVREPDLPKARDLLSSQQYHSDHTRRGADETVDRQAEHHDIFQREDGQIRVELHWRITPAHLEFPLDFDSLWERLESVSLAGTTVANLPPEALLLTLCVHGSKHSWIQLKWICDIAELIRVHPELDWEQVLEQSRTLRCSRMLYVGLILAHDLLEAALPQEVLGSAQNDRVAASLGAQVRRRLFGDADAVSSIFQITFFPLWAQEHPRDRWRCALHMAFRRLTPTDRDRALLPLPAFLSFFYYLFRPLRLAAEYGIRTGRVLRKPGVNGN